MPQGHGDPMDVDALNHRKGKQPQKGKAAQKPKFPLKKGVGRLPPHPTASNLKNSTPIMPAAKKPFYCYVCDQPGHYARNCKASINQIDVEHIRQLGMAVETAFDSQTQEDEEEEDEQNDEDYEGDDLISFEEMTTSSDANDDAFGQGF